MDHHPGQQGGFDAGGGGPACFAGYGPGVHPLSELPARRRGTRTGFTTGACAAAAAQAATLALRCGQLPAMVQTRLPNGQVIPFAVAAGSVSAQQASAVVIKDAGDDPDCTHGARLTAHVRLLAGEAGRLQLRGGDGVGIVTRPGLGLPLQEHAINPVPRRNILDNAREAAGDWLVQNGLEIVISVPGGEELAKRTLNPRLGILGGLSILGTSGIVYPYSTVAFKAAMQQSIQAAAALQLPALVLTTGRRTERFAMQQLPDLPESAFIQMGDFVGAALHSCSQEAISTLYVAAMVGKLAKIGQGFSNTHAHKGRVDMAWLARLAAEAGADATLCRQVQEGVTVRHASELLAERGLEQAFLQQLVAAARSAMLRRLPVGCHLTLFAFDFAGQLCATGADS
ncbi:MAG: cobalt-precorrin-5B (C(1))-methyltransferase [Magnetococcales bacterium]|nr:cobalt-precorrin-5B (C(1))-methyltransferase [Magnetococcales bacterium]